MLYFLENAAFYIKNNDVKTPFQSGFSMEEYFLKHMAEKNLAFDKQGRLYIPCLWTNFQNEPKFKEKQKIMQEMLDFYVKCHPNPAGYFIVIQDFKGPLLTLPKQTICYSTHSGNIPLPFIYEDSENLFSSFNKKSFKEKTILCSFVGNRNANLRNDLFSIYCENSQFRFSFIQKNDPIYKKSFLETTRSSKFSLVPRTKGSQFYDILKTGTIPVYIYDDTLWLPFNEKIDYKKIAVLIQETEIDILDDILLSINEKKYNSMLEEYEKIKYMFELEYVCEYISEFPRMNREPKREPNRVLLSTIVIGETNLENYEKTFRKNHQNYAIKHNYDFEVITDYIDASYKYCNQSIDYQKLLICEKEREKEYDFIVYIHNNIFINSKAPAIHSFVDLQGKIGIIDTYEKNYPFDLEKNKVLNSGVYIVQPNRHKELLEQIYFECMPIIIYNNREPTQESKLIIDEPQIQSRNTKTISNKWNATLELGQKCNDQNIEHLFKEHYFLHVLGDIENSKTAQLDLLLNRII